MIDVASPGDRGRLSALHAYRLLDSDAEPAFDAFVALAAETCDVPVAYVAFVDDTRQRLKATFGLTNAREIPRDAMCDDVLRSAGVVEIVDATCDVRLAGTTFVAGPPHLRFHAAVPLVDRDGFALGMLAVGDVRARTLDARQREVLCAAAASLVVLVESRRGIADATFEKLSLIGAAVENASDPIAILKRFQPGDRFHFTYVNHAFAQLFEYDATSLIGQRPPILYGPLTDVDEIADIRRSLRADNFASLVVAFYTARGARLTLDMKIHQIDDEHWVMNLADLTQINAARDALTLSNQRLSSLLGNNSDAVLTFDHDGRCVDANPAAISLLGGSHTDVIGDDVLERLRGGEIVGFEKTFDVGDDRAVVAECRAVPMVVRGDVDGAYLILRDVTEQRRLERLLDSHARRTRALYLLCAQSDGDELAHVDSALSLVRECFDMDFAYVGRIDGGRLVVSNIVGDPFFEVGDGFAIAGTFVERTMRGADVDAIGDLATELSRAPNSLLSIGWHGYISAPLFVEGRLWGAITFLARHAVVFDEFDVDFARLVTALVASMLERISQRERLDRLAFYDTLTELPNRTRFLRDLDEAIARGARSGRPFALHYVDLDRFKAINDRGGHDAGDLALQEVARRLRATTRPYDSLGRIGGDEFVVLQREIATAEDAMWLGERIVRTLGDAYDLDGRCEADVGASVGFAIFPSDGESASTLMKAADAALYRAKAAGKRRVERA